MYLLAIKRSMKKNIQLFKILFLLFPTGFFSQIISPTFVDSVPVPVNKYLKVDVYKPSSCSQCPVILIQTPYNKNLFKLGGLPLGVKYNINSSDYIFVIMDWRGRFSNLGAAHPGNQSMGKDGRDVVEWIASQPWCNGKIGTWGPSALARVQYATAKENPPHLTCICPLVAFPQYDYLEYYPGGCLRTEYLQQLDNLGFGMSSFIMPNHTKNSLWQYTENVTYRPDSIFVPALMIGGWYDHNIDGMLRFFNGIRTLSPSNVRDKHRIQMGPWAHGGNGTAYVGSAKQGQLEYANAQMDNDSLALRFFDFYLRNVPNGYDNTPYVTYYQMGDNNWQTSATWPIGNLTSVNYYFHSDNSLSTSTPTGTSNFLSFNYNPNDPSPTIGGPTLRNDLKQGPWRQDTAVENRSDVQLFTTPVLNQDVVVKGKAKVTLKVSSNRKDTDFMVRLCDVYPDGKSMLVNTGVIRMRFRNGFAPADTSNITPGTIYTATVDLPATCITFKAGHRIRVSISSSNYPQYNRNMNTGAAMYPGNNPDVLVNPVIATNTLYLNQNDFCFITLPVENTTTASEHHTFKKRIKVYPNPASTSIVVETPVSGKLNIFSLEGKQVLSNVFIDSLKEVDITGLSKGLYILIFDDGKEKVYEKMVIE